MPPNTNPINFAKGFSFFGSINGHQLPWTRARVVFDYRNGAGRVFFDYECGLQIVDDDTGGQRVDTRLDQFAVPGEEFACTIEQLDRQGVVVGRWATTKAKLVSYSVAWDNAADQVTPERIRFEAKLEDCAGPR